jgi:hypothetical protein
MRSFHAKVAEIPPRPRRNATVLRVFSLILLALVLGMSAAPALAQGCAMCYATARATPKDGQLALNRAILVMVLPPIGAMTLGVGAAIRYSKKRDSENDDNPL